ncbi:MAG: hypothetical protein GY811_09900 [Myxococcales bacterium]|nr:hypothetical protein [Myxococcales bacterium]
MDSYIDECRVRGLADSTIEKRQCELERSGVWLKKQRPRVAVGAIDVELVTGYIQSRKTFRAKASVASAMSELRCMGEFLVREGEWRAILFVECAAQSSILAADCRGASSRVT